MTNLRQGIVLFFLFLYSFSVLAKPTLNIPEPLQPWKEWVLYGSEHQLCPTPYNNGDEFICIWPSELNLSLEEHKGQFTEKVINYVEGFVPLPGDSDHWPENVKANNKVVAVISHDGLPAVFLPPGEYLFQGQFTWDNLPDFIQIPPNTGALNLTLSSKQIEQPNRAADGKVWFQRVLDETKLNLKEDSLGIQVYRLIQDEIPQVDNTLIRLKVTGQIREVSIGPVLQSDTLPLHIMSPLPSKLEDNGMLRVQVKPGVWDIHIKSRFLSKQDKLTYKLQKAPWPENEILSFQPHNELRLVEIEGGTSLDPQQTDMPQGWKSYPCYLMNEGSVLSLVEKRRGEEKRPSQISIQRKLWLDFSGEGFIAQDIVTGGIYDNWRLSLISPYVLGQATLDGQDRLITQTSPNDPPGIEIRQGQLNLIAVSRILGKPFTLPAVGWDFDVRSLSTTLFLPPGWKLVGAWGVDSVTHAWVQEWTLLDLFLVLIMAAAITKLLGLGWGIIALLTLTLIYHENGAPIYSWLNLIGALALLRALPFGKFRTFVLYYSRVSFVILALIALPFMVMQIRQAIYPQLTPPNQSYAFMAGQQNQAAMQGMVALPSSARAAKGAMMESADQAKMLMEGGSGGMMEPKPISPPQPLNDYDPNAKVQTGPGVPQWQWDISQLVWNGPVLKDQKITLWILPRFVTSILKVADVILMFVFIYGLFTLWRINGSDDKPTILPQSKLTILPLLWMIMFSLGTVLGMMPSKALADFPSQPLLDEFKQRLLIQPQCMPECATASRMQVEVDSNQLTIRLTEQISVKSAVPLPSSLGKWLPRSILVDGTPAKGLQFDATSQQLWVLLEEGVHEIVLEGPIGGQDKFEIQIPQKPIQVTTQANGWQIDGVFHHRLQGDNLYLTRIKPSQEASRAATLQSGRMPTFVVVTRTLQLGFDWEVLNELKREAPQQGGINIEVPLLPGELVMSDNVEMKDNKVYVSLGENQQKISWKSKLKTTSEINLNAISSPSVKEIWHVDAISQWHCHFEGIPIIHQQNAQGRWFPTWYPWPGETLNIQVSRPQAVVADTITIDNSRITTVPGKRATDSTLNLMARSSLGGTHVIKVPQDAILHDVLINGLSQPINAKQGEISIPLHPGSQQIEVKWQVPQGISSHYVTPNIDLNMQSSNTIIDVELSSDRWILLLGGPLIGPAVLIWGILIVVLIVSIGLGRYAKTPLSTWEWFLLGVGLSVASPLAAIFVVAWFFAMQKRSQVSSPMTELAFEIMQISLGVLTFLFVVSLFTSISNGLLGTPKMQLGSPVMNNVHSVFNVMSKYQLQWYQDISTKALPQAWVISLPLYVYRILMLLWALWLAFSLIKWLRWGWHCFSTEGLWHQTKSKT